MSSRLYAPLGARQPSTREDVAARTDGVHVRTACPADYGPIITVVDSWWGRPMALGLPRLFLDHFWASSQVGEDQEGVAGFLIGFVHFVGVRPDRRRGGLARHLYHAFAARARELGCTELQAITSPTNTGSIGFHRSIGFTVSDVIDDYNGRGRPMVTFRHPLDPPSTASDLAEGLPEGLSE
jgi:GNAT superfamily N-acetyltransferase